MPSARSDWIFKHDIHEETARVLESFYVDVCYALDRTKSLLVVAKKYREYLLHRQDSAAISAFAIREVIESHGERIDGPEWQDFAALAKQVDRPTANHKEAAERRRLRALAVLWGHWSLATVTHYKWELHSPKLLANLAKLACQFPRWEAFVQMLNCIMILRHEESLQGGHVQRIGYHHGTTGVKDEDSPLEACDVKRLLKNRLTDKQVRDLRTRITQWVNHEYAEFQVHGKPAKDYPNIVFYAVAFDKYGMLVRADQSSVAVSRKRRRPRSPHQAAEESGRRPTVRWSSRDAYSTSEDDIDMTAGSRASVITNSSASSPHPSGHTVLQASESENEKAAWTSLVSTDCVAGQHASAALEMAAGFSLGEANDEELNELRAASVDLCFDTPAPMFVPTSTSTPQWDDMLDLTSLDVPLLPDTSGPSCSTVCSPDEPAHSPGNDETRSNSAGASPASSESNGSLLWIECSTPLTPYPLQPDAFDSGEAGDAWWKKDLPLSNEQCSSAVVPALWDEEIRRQMFDDAHQASQLVSNCPDNALRVWKNHVAFAVPIKDPASIHGDVYALSSASFKYHAVNGHTLTKPVIIKEHFSDTGEWSPSRYAEQLEIFRDTEMQLPCDQGSRSQRVSVSRLIAKLRDDSPRIMEGWSSSELQLPDLTGAMTPSFLQLDRFRTIDLLVERYKADLRRQLNTTDCAFGGEGLQKFNTITWPGTFSGPCINGSMRTWVRSIFGRQLWVFVPRSEMTEEDWQAFARAGDQWDPGSKGRAIILEPGDVFLMEAGLVHAVLTLGKSTPSLLLGGVYIDRKDLLGSIYFTCRSQRLPNPSRGPSACGTTKILEVLEKLVRQNPAMWLGNEDLLPDFCTKLEKVNTSICNKHTFVNENSCGRLLCGCPQLHRIE